MSSGHPPGEDGLELLAGCGLSCLKHHLHPRAIVLGRPENSLLVKSLHGNASLIPPTIPEELGRLAIPTDDLHRLQGQGLELGLGSIRQRNFI